MTTPEPKVVHIRAPLPDRWKRAKERIAEIKANLPKASDEPKVVSETDHG